MKKSDNINELAIALSRAQSEMELAAKDANNPYFNSKYSNLASVWQVAQGPITKQGLSIVQVTNARDDGKIEGETILLHSSGQWISGTMIMQPIDNKGKLSQSPHAIGSAISYYRRYGLKAILGIADGEDDDDGNLASGKGEHTKSDNKKDEDFVGRACEKSESNKGRVKQALYIAEKIQEMTGSDSEASEMLYALSCFTIDDPKEGKKIIPGYRSANLMLVGNKENNKEQAKDKRITVIYGAVKKEYERFKKETKRGEKVL